MNRAYVWLSNGMVIGYRDLETGHDRLDSTEHLGVYIASIEEWLITYGVRCARMGPEQAPPRKQNGRGLLGWWRRRRFERHEAARIAAQREWELDRPVWRIPIDPPHGAWRDLVRNDAGAALWEQVAVRTPTSWQDRKGYSEARAWRVGALGEESVGAELQHLARSGVGDWRYVHSVPVGSRGSDIDHVLVGPAGVFTINTKAHAGSAIWVAGNTFMVNGQRQRYVHNSRFEATRAARLIGRASGLEVPVRGLIVVDSPREFTVREHPDGVEVTTRHQLQRWIRNQPRVLSTEQVDVIFGVVRRSSTWTNRAPIRTARGSP